MNNDLLKIAEMFEAEAARLRKAAVTSRPLPEFWSVGDRVRFLVDKEFGPEKGSIGIIVELAEPDKKIPAKDYQVFWVAPEPDKYNFRFWTTPDEVELA